MHFVRSFSIMSAQGVRLIAIEEVRNYGKLYISKTVLKIAGGWMYTHHPTPLDRPLRPWLKAISYRNYQKSLAYFSHLAPLVLFFLLKGRVKRGGHGTMPPPPLNTLLLRSQRLGACERIISSIKGG